MSEKQKESVLLNIRPARVQFFNGARWAPWLLVPALGAGGALAGLQGLDALTATPIVASLIACCWEAQINGTRAVGQFIRGLCSVVLLGCAALPLAIGGGLLLQRVGPLWVGSAAMGDMVEIALPLMRQVEERAEASVPSKNWINSVILPKGGPIEVVIVPSGEISLIRLQPLAILILKPVLQQGFGARKIGWSCSGSPSRELPTLCQR